MPMTKDDLFKLVWDRMSVAMKSVADELVIDIHNLPEGTDAHVLHSIFFGVLLEKCSALARELMGFSEADFVEMARKTFTGGLPADRALGAPRN